MCSDTSQNLLQKTLCSDQSTIRQSVLDKLASLSESQLEEAAAKAYLEVIKHPFYKRATKIAFYKPIQYEIDLSLCVLRSEKIEKKNLFSCGRPKSFESTQFCPL